MTRNTFGKLTKCLSIAPTTKRQYMQTSGTVTVEWLFDKYDKLVGAGALKPLRFGYGSELSFTRTKINIKTFCRLSCRAYRFRR